ncbi:hypothetical protein B566_EDAN007746 [Ephemera danica]|nr:hypothetical protein B566_EDAN007746 [Ephemera danica]
MARIPSVTLLLLVFIQGVFKIEANSTSTLPPTTILSSNSTTSIAPNTTRMMINTTSLTSTTNTTKVTTSTLPTPTSTIPPSGEVANCPGKMVLLGLIIPLFSMQF